MDPVRVDRGQHVRTSKSLFACQHQVKQLRNYVFIVSCSEVVMSFYTFSRYSWHSVSGISAVNNISDCEYFWHKRTKPRNPVLISNESAWFAGALSVIMSLFLHDLSALKTSLLPGCWHNSHPGDWSPCTAKEDDAVCEGQQQNQSCDDPASF